MRANRSTGTTRGRRRVALVTISLSLLLAMVLPLTGYVMHDAGMAFAADDEKAKAEEAVNPRAEYWREVRQGTEGYTSVSGPEAGVLIQNGGENWRELRTGPLMFWGGWFVIVILLAIAAKHLIKGKDKLEGGRSGRTILRWSLFERLLHWSVAILFIILAITGFSLLFGRTVLIPLLGKEGFAAWAQLAKPMHDYLALPFVALLALMLLIWIPRNIMRSYDFKWLKSMGGYFGKGHEDAPAHFANGGEKVFFWLLFVFGIALTISGFYLLFPNLGTEREAMQMWNLVHGIAGVVLTGITLGHIYLGTIGVEGVFEGMVGGDVDEAFARQHHNLWYEDVKGAAPQGGRAKASDTTTAAPT